MDRYDWIESILAVALLLCFGPWIEALLGIAPWGKW